MKFKRLITVLTFVFLTIVASCLKAQEYSIEMNRSSSMSEARQQANFASALVPYQCRVINEAGTFIILCGKTNDQKAFEVDIKRLHQQDFLQVKLANVAEDEVALFTYDPVLLNENSQQHLIDMIQQQQLFSVAKNENKMAAKFDGAEAQQNANLKQGEYFIDRGWQAVSMDDLDFALSMFQLAVQINSVKDQASYGIAVIYSKQEKWLEAMQIFEDLRQHNYPESTLSEQIVNSAFNAKEFDKARLYVEELAVELRIDWRKRLRGQDMILALEALKKKSSKKDLAAFKLEFYTQLEDCNPYQQWIAFAKLSYKRGLPALNVETLTELLEFCSLNDQKISLLYHLKKYLSERKLIQYINSQKPKADKAFKKQLRKIHVESLLQLAVKYQQKWPQQRSVLNEALEVFPYDINTRVMLGWNHYHQKQFLQARNLFRALWEKYQRRTALEGLLFSLAANNEIDAAIKLADEHKMKKQLLTLLKTKLGSLPNESEDALKTAQLILKYEQNYLPAHSAIGWHYVKKKQWKQFEKAFEAWQKINRTDNDAPEPISMISLHGWAYYLRDQYTKSYKSFANAYRRAENAEEQESAVNGLLYSSYQSNKWSELLNLANEKPGLLLSDVKERDVITRLAAGSLLSSQITVKNGYYEELPLEQVTRSEEFFDFFEGLPGYTWGTIRQDEEGRDTTSYLFNQGVDWVILPGDIMLNTFVEYRSINNELRFFNDDSEAVVGIDLSHKPFHLGVEYVLDHWQEESRGRYYLSWYHDWYEYIGGRNSREKSWLDIDAHTGSTYARITKDFTGGTTIQGYVSQGTDWFTFAEDITFNTSISYRFRFRSIEKTFYEAHGPSVAIELQKGPFTLGIDYSWSNRPHLNIIEEDSGIYFRWYYQWDLK